MQNLSFLGMVVFSMVYNEIDPHYNDNDLKWMKFHQISIFLYFKILIYTGRLFETIINVDCLCHAFTYITRPTPPICMLHLNSISNFGHWVGLGIMSFD